MPMIQCSSPRSLIHRVSHSPSLKWRIACFKDPAIVRSSTSMATMTSSCPCTYKRLHVWPDSTWIPVYIWLHRSGGTTHVWLVLGCIMHIIAGRHGSPCQELHSLWVGTCRLSLRGLHWGKHHQHPFVLIPSHYILKWLWWCIWWRVLLSVRTFPCSWCLQPVWSLVQLA